ncbi:hypothetical protein GOBAR_DD04332 [Gossypium barbadense]|nr:hypothetical protein GOBAR_DD04332 [Gossypium barbadense]
MNTSTEYNVKVFRFKISTSKVASGPTLLAGITRAHSFNTASEPMLLVDVIKVCQFKIAISKAASGPSVSIDITRARKVKLAAPTQLADLRSQLMS